MRLAFDPKHTLSYGYYRCLACKHEFYGNGPALHEEGCPTPDYNNCVYLLGVETVAAVKSWAETHDADTPHPIVDVTLNEVREQLPELFAEEGTNDASPPY